MEEENFSNFGKFKGKVGSKIFRFFFDFRFLAPRGRSMKGSCGSGGGGGKFFKFW